MVAAVERVRRGLIAHGLFEALTLPMGPDADADSVRLLNPVSAADAALRRRLVPGLLRQVELNWSLRERDVRLFEIGTVFTRGEPGQLPVERQHVGAIVTGAREPAHWTGIGGDVDLWDLNGLFEAAVALAAPGAEIAPDGEGWVARLGERVIGSAGAVEGDAPPWAGRVYGLEVEVVETAPPAARFEARPALPSAERDLTLLVPDGVAAGRLAGVLSGAGVAVLESVRTVNEYRGPRVAAGTRSVTFRLTFRAADRTLESAEVDQAESRLLAALERETGVRRREQTDPAPE